MLNHGADINARSFKYEAYLQASVMAGHKTAISLLLHHGAFIAFDGSASFPGCASSAQA
jgi:hypothetical protein